MSRAALLLIPVLLSLGQAETPRWTGEVSIVGNEPFTAVALTDDQGRQWRLSGEATRELAAQAQGGRVVVTGRSAGGGIAVETWTWASEVSP